MFGGWEIVVVVVVLALLFGYKYLPALGRSAGKGTRELKESVGGMAAEHDVTTESLGRKAGAGMREIREFKDTFKASATADPPPPANGAAKPAPQPAAAEAEADDPESKA